jgi:hypothetical protein
MLILRHKFRKSLVFWWSQIKKVFPVCYPNVYCHFQQFISYIMTTRFHGGRKNPTISMNCGQPYKNRCLETLNFIEVSIMVLTQVLGLWSKVKCLNHMATQTSFSTLRPRLHVNIICNWSSWAYMHFRLNYFRLQLLVCLFDGV